MIAYSQRDPLWKDTALGYGTGTIGQYGCTITSLAMIWVNRGLPVDPKTINATFKAAGVFGGATKNLVVWANVAQAYPQVEQMVRKYGFNSTEVEVILRREGCVLVEVDGRPIGATKHWVVLLAGNMILDPWDLKPAIKKNLYTITGYVDLELIAPRFPNQEEEEMSSTIIAFAGTTTDKNTIERMSEHLGERNGKCEWGDPSNGGGGHLGAERRKTAQLAHENTQLKDQVIALTNQVEEAQRLYGKLEQELEAMAEKLAECKLEKPEIPSTPAAGLPETAKLNGITRSYTQGAFTITENYEIREA